MTEPNKIAFYFVGVRIMNNEFYIEFPIEFPKYSDNKPKIKSCGSGGKIWPDAIACPRDLASSKHREGRSYPQVADLHTSGKRSPAELRPDR